MPVHVDEMTSEVSTEAGAPATGTGAAMVWEDTAHIRDVRAQLARDARRTSAENYDD
ncbi:MAG TPA: hypothetical protein VFB65_08755 [Pyrinomonadaceae bacterium]|nr:hypothetical protein [Pyrinomonadaceae bacterium]